MNPHAQESVTPTWMLGQRAKVWFDNGVVTMTPADGVSIEDLNFKMKTLDVFNDITTNVPGLYHPKLLSRDAQHGRYEMEIAPGMNLSSFSHEVHGSMAEFFDVSSRVKLEAMVTYLRAIAAVNKAGYCFIDHKPDSVFMDPSKKVISIVDTDDMTAQDAYIWEEEMRLGLKKTLESFFTRGNESMNATFLIPGGVGIVLEHLSEYKSAQDVIAALEGWSRGEETLKYGERMDPVRHLTALAKIHNLTDLIPVIEATDFSTRTDFIRDMFECEIYRRAFVKDGEPASLDRAVQAQKKH